jgi:hypothetical protein
VITNPFLAEPLEIKVAQDKNISKFAIMTKIAKQKWCKKCLLCRVVNRMAG